MILSSCVDNSVVQFITVTLIFVFVLAITYFTTRWIGSYQKKQMSHGNIQIIESSRLSNSKVLEVVKVGDRCFLIAVCKDTVTSIGEVHEDSLDLSDSSGKPSAGDNFGNVFARFKVQHKDETDHEEEQDPFKGN